MRVKRGGDVVGTLRTERSFFPSADPTLGPVSRFFEGEATSEVGLRAGLRRDVWSAISPNVRDLRKQVAEGDKRVQRRQGAAGRRSARSRSPRRSTASRAPTRRTRRPPPSA